MGEELTRVLLHIAKHRGWKSNRKSEEGEEVKSKMKKGISDTEKLLEDNDCLTVGYYYGKQKLENDYNNYKITNTVNFYDRSIGRETNKKELEEIFIKQKSFDNEFITNEFVENILKIFDWQEEPKSIKLMVGKCLFETEEYRAAKESYSAELFNVYNKINNLKLNLEEEELNNIIKLFHDKEKISYKDIKKVLNKEYIRFNFLDYYQKYFLEQNKTTKEFSKESLKEIQKLEGQGYKAEYINNKVFFKNLEGSYYLKNPEEREIYSMSGFHKVKKVLKKNEKAWGFVEKNPYIIDKIIESLCFEKTDEESKESMLKNGVPEYVIEDCLNISSQKFIHISGLPQIIT